MSKCRPSCCPGNSSLDGIMAVIGLIFLAAAAYGIVRAIWRALVTIVEIAAISTGSIAALTVLIIITVRVIRWQHSRSKPETEPNLITLDSATPPVIAALGPGNAAPDAAELFAEAVANGMDPRFVERILDTAMKRRPQ